MIFLSYFKPHTGQGRRRGYSIVFSPPVRSSVCSYVLPMLRVMIVISISHIIHFMKGFLFLLDASIILKCFCCLTPGGVKLPLQFIVYKVVCSIPWKSSKVLSQNKRWPLHTHLRKGLAAPPIWCYESQNFRKVGELMSQTLQNFSPSSLSRKIHIDTRL